MITSLKQLDLTKRYTYGDYLKWQFLDRVELFKGIVVKMSPAPNRRHQNIVGNVFFELKLFLKKRNCQVFPAPFDVRLPLPFQKVTSNKVNTVVQPDITVVCDLSKLDKQGCKQAPDLVVEILSPGNSKKEMSDKFELYQNAGIPEYWLVDPERETVVIYQLGEDQQYFTRQPFTSDDTLTSPLLKGLKIDLSEIFES